MRVHFSIVMIIAGERYVMVGQAGAELSVLPRS